MTLGTNNYIFINERKLKEGGSCMGIQLIFDWKFVLALGVSVVASIVAAKLDKTAAENVSIHAVDSVKECASTHSVVD